MVYLLVNRRNEGIPRGQKGKKNTKKKLSRNENPESKWSKVRLGLTLLSFINLRTKQLGRPAIQIPPKTGQPVEHSLLTLCLSCHSSSQIWKQGCLNHTFTTRGLINFAQKVAKRPPWIWPGKGETFSLVKGRCCGHSLKAAEPQDEQMAVAHKHVPSKRNQRQRLAKPSA